MTLTTPLIGVVYHPCQELDIAYLYTKSDYSSISGYRYMIAAAQKLKWAT